MAICDNLPLKHHNVCHRKKICFLLIILTSVINVKFPTPHEPVASLLCVFLSVFVYVCTKQIYQQSHNNLKSALKVSFSPFCCHQLYAFVLSNTPMSLLSDLQVALQTIIQTASVRQRPSLSLQSRDSKCLQMWHVTIVQMTTMSHRYN